MSNILFVLSGSIACYKACDAISQLVQRGHHVRAVATNAALKFVGVATLEGLTQQKVATDLFEPGAALEHITLVRWADVTVVCPATANTLNSMAAGLADDLAGSLLLAHEWTKPLLVAPAMNPAMWTHPATAAAVERLKRWGAQLIQIGAGRTACGEVGEGRLAEANEIVAAIEAALVAPSRRLRVLVTSGGTVEPIDGVRVLGNTSTGETGALIAEHFARRGHDVVLLRARTAAAPQARCEEDLFTTFADLDVALEKQLGDREFDAVVHAAAVGDFSIERIEVGGQSRKPSAHKLGSDQPVTLRLQPNPKLLDSLRGRSRNRAVRIVAFKLTRGARDDEAKFAVTEITRRGVADFVVHNDLAQRTDGGTFPAEIWNAAGLIVERCSDRSDIGIALEKLLVTASPGVAAAPSDRPPAAKPALKTQSAKP
jgi:phosphopantothenoylcysteine decarboxylase / phosphopantothenate---cysteine ligase